MMITSRLRAEGRDGGRNPASSPTSISQRRHPTCISAAHSLVGEQRMAALAVICKIASEIQINSVCVSWACRPVSAAGNLALSFLGAPSSGLVR